jgi:hypothetical protein
VLEAIKKIYYTIEQVKNFKKYLFFTFYIDMVATEEIKGKAKGNCDVNLMKGNL